MLRSYIMFEKELKPRVLFDKRSSLKSVMCMEQTSSNLLGGGARQL